MARLFDRDVLTNRKATPDKLSAVRTTTMSMNRSRRTAALLGACLGAVAAISLVWGSARAQITGEDGLRPMAEGASGSSDDADAEASRSNAPRTLAGPVDPAAYRLGPGDVRSLEYGGKAQDAKVLTVDA